MYEDPKSKDILEFLQLDELNRIALNHAGKQEYLSAIECFKKIIEIDRNNDRAYFNLGLTHQLLSQNAPAREAYQLAISKNPRNTDALLNLGVLSVENSDFLKAAECFNEIVKYIGKNYDALYNLGFCFQNLKRYEKAVESYRAASELNPSSPDPFNNTGLLYLEIKNFAEAEKYFLLALKADPENLDTLNNLGHLKLISNLPDEAAVFLQRAEKLALNAVPRQSVLVYGNMGVLNYKLGNYDRALYYYNRAIDIDPQAVSPHHNKFSVLLLKGDFHNGWKEYEWRMRKKDWGTREIKNPLKPGENINGKRVLVIAEQGFGDAIQFVRYLPMLKERGAYVALECFSHLMNLFENIEGADEIIEIDSAPLAEPEFDFTIPLLSLPYYFGTDISNIPSREAYIFPKSEKLTQWAPVINKTEKKKIGIVWAGSPIHINDANRSCPLEIFSEILDVNNAEFFSLQRGPGRSEAEGHEYGFTDLESLGLTDFTDTAAVISHLDLVITVDTSVAHLAGAMGKAVWVMLPFVPDWRWLLNRNDSPWYPSMKLYRQEIRGVWSDVVENIKSDLEEFTNTGLLNMPLKVSRSGNEKPVTPEIVIALAKGDNFGWGVCSKYLKAGLAKRFDKIIMPDSVPDSKAQDYLCFQAIMDIDFNPLYDLRGKYNVGYTFFENNLTEQSLLNSAKFDIVLGGSSWNMEKMREKGIGNSGFLIQGIDPELFFPADEKPNDEMFVIFSGGKFELRKGQDMVLKAVKIMQNKYPDVILINSWYNFWPVTMQPMSLSPYIKFQMGSGSWNDFMNNMVSINGLDPKRVISLPLMPNEKMREIYLKSNIGLFPNRCEGGTNLVMMEYMACGRPVIASFNTGHMDIINQDNSLPLTYMRDFYLPGENGNTLAQWFEADLDEIVSTLEYAYFNRDKINSTGIRAGEFMKEYTWDRASDELAGIFNSLVIR